MKKRKKRREKKTLYLCFFLQKNREETKTLQKGIPWKGKDLSSVKPLFKLTHSLMKGLFCSKQPLVCIPLSWKQSNLRVTVSKRIFVLNCSLLFPFFFNVYFLPCLLFVLVPTIPNFLPLLSLQELQFFRCSFLLVLSVMRGKRKGS